MRTVLEVRQTWQDTHLDTRHFSTGEVRVGSDVAWRWRFFGVDMGRVPAAMRYVLPYLPPILSDCEPVENADFTLDDPSVEPLFHHTDEGWELTLPPGWSAVDAAGHPTEALDGDGPITIRAGDVAFTARVVPAAAATPRQTPDPDPPMLASFSLLAGTAALFAFGVWMAPGQGTLSVHEVQERAVQMALQAPPAPKPQPVAKADGGAKGASTAEPAEAAGPRDPEAGSREHDVQVASNAGLLPTLNLLDAFSGGGLGELADDVDRLAVSSGGGPRIGGGVGRGGSSMREGNGPGGLGDDAFGPPGGGGQGEYGYGPGGSKKPGIGVLTPQDPILIGNLDRKLVDAVIKKHLAQIRYCYQRQLQKQAGLGGRLVVKFTIARDGSVSAASLKKDELGSPAVGQCVVGRVMRMKFPAPQGGGIAIVSYPFYFQPG